MMPGNLKKRKCKPPTRRRGSLTVELVLVLPILVLLLLAMIQFSLMLTARQQLLSASREGARMGARGGSAADIECAARRVLGDGSLAQADVQSQRAPEQPGAPVGGSECVQVMVHIPIGAAVPNFLSWLFSADDELTACTVMHCE
jgi:hypothetical protein